MEATPVEMLETRLKSIENAREFFKMECNEHLLEDRCFNSGFVLDVLKRRKKLIPSTSFEILNLKRMKFIKIYDRKNLFRIVSEDNDMRLYIPDNCKAENFTRNSLLLVRIIDII